MRNILILFLLISSSVFSQAKKVFSPNMALIITNVEAFEVGPCTIYTNNDVTVNLYETEALKNDAVTKITAALFPALPASGTIYQDKYYSYSGTVVKCLQTHERTIFAPSLTPALFAVYRENTGTLNWTANEHILIGWVRIYNAIKYVCIQAHTTVEGLTPDKTPALWNVIPTSQAWTTGVAYKVDDIVTYDGSTYKCLQAHTSISTWYPSIVPALWFKI